MIFCYFILLVLSSLVIYAFPITPTYFHQDFVPNKQFMLDYTIYNKEENPLEIVVTMSGALENNTKILGDTHFVIEPRGSRAVFLEITLPNEVEPGPQLTHFKNTEILKGGAKAIGGRVEIDIVLTLWVPYPGKYLDSKLVANDANLGQPVQFQATLESQGNESIFDIHGSVDIFEGAEKIGEVEFPVISNMTPGSAKKVNAKWNYGGEIRPGIYTARSTFRYENAFTKAKAGFKIGDLIIEIHDVKGTKVRKGRINKLEAFIFSKWNQEIPDVYSVLEFVDQENLITSKSETKPIGPWSNDTFDLYLDANDLELGVYDGTVKVFYLGNVTSKDIEIEVVRGILDRLISIEALLILLLILLIIIWLLYKKVYKNRQKTKKYEKK